MIRAGMMIKASDIITESIVDGEGLRLVVFAQGCLHHCPGCHNPGTHSFHGGYPVDNQEIVDLILMNPLLDGVTFSGGDPFFQAEAFSELASAIREKILPLIPDFNILAYTGFTFEKLMEDKKRYLPLLEKIDILIDGPYIAAKKTMDLNFTGSSNQRILDVSKSLITGKPVILPHSDGAESSISYTA